MVIKSKKVQMTKSRRALLKAVYQLGMPRALYENKTIAQIKAAEKKYRGKTWSKDFPTHNWPRVKSSPRVINPVWKLWLRNSKKYTRAKPLIRKRLNTTTKLYFLYRDTINQDDINLRKIVSRPGKPDLRLTRVIPKWPLYDGTRAFDIDTGPKIPYSH